MRSQLLVVKRSVAFASVFAALLIYPYAAQIAYERFGHTATVKIALFVIVILTTNFFWEACKRTWTLERERLDAFLVFSGKAALSLVLYGALFVLFVQLLGSWAGLGTILVLLFGQLSVACGLYGVDQLGKAIECAVREMPPLKKLPPSS